MRETGEAVVRVQCDVSCWLFRVPQVPQENAPVAGSGGENVVRHAPQVAHRTGGDVRRQDRDASHGRAKVPAFNGAPRRGDTIRQRRSLGTVDDAPSGIAPAVVLLHVSVSLRSGKFAVRRQTARWRDRRATGCVFPRRQSPACQRTTGRQWTSRPWQRQCRAAARSCPSFLTRAWSAAARRHQPFPTAASGAAQRAAPQGSSRVPVPSM